MSVVQRLHWLKRKILDDLENFMYAIYDSHREEMLKNNK